MGLDLKATEATLPGPTPIFALLPPGAARGVVVLHEIFGRTPEIDRVVERFARRGMAAVAPDLFAAGFKPLCIAAAMRDSVRGTGAAFGRVRAARDWLCATAGLAADKVGVIGFCLGGGFALAAGPDYGSVSTNYGDVPASEVMRGIGPVIGCYGGRDRVFGRMGAKLKARLAPLGVVPEVLDYPSVGHSFLTDGRHPIAAALSRFTLHTEAVDPRIREEAWARIFEFFERTL